MKPCNRDPSRRMISSLFEMDLSDLGAFKVICFTGLGFHAVAFLMSSARERSSIHLFRKRFLSVSLLASFVAFMYSSAAWLAVSSASSFVLDLSISFSAF